MSGNMENAEVTIDALSICLNITGWAMMISLGFLAGAGVRVSYEIGRGSSRVVKYSTVHYEFTFSVQIFDGYRNSLYGIDVMRKICNHLDLLEKELADQKDRELDEEMNVLRSLFYAHGIHDVAPEIRKRSLYSTCAPIRYISVPVYCRC